MGTTIQEIGSNGFDRFIGYLKNLCRMADKTLVVYSVRICSDNVLVQSVQMCSGNYITP